MLLKEADKLASAPVTPGAGFWGMKMIATPMAGPNRKTPISPKVHFQPR
jgi:hypothetical protein